MALSKPLFFLHLKSLHPSPLLRFPFSLPSIRHLSFSSPEEAAAERRRRKRRLRIDPFPSSSSRNNNQQTQQQRIPSKSPPNPNAPKIPEPLTALSSTRLSLHNRILTLIRSNDLDEASLLTRHSIYSNCRPTIYTVNAVLSSLLHASRYSDLLSLHRFITQASLAPTIITHNLLLQAYCDCRKTDTALQHFRLITHPDSNTPFSPSPTTFRILTAGLIHNNKLPQALDLKSDMLNTLPPDPVVYNLLMQGYINNTDFDGVLDLYNELKEKLGGGVIENGIVYGNLMKGYFGKGMETEAMEVFVEVLKEGSKVRFDAERYNYVLDALGKNGKLDEAVGLFDRMMKEHDYPLRVTVNVGSFNVMVDAYCKEGRFDEAVRVFGWMGEKKCCSPDAMSYNNLMEQLGRNKWVGEAEELYREMGERGVSPDEHTYVLLVEVCFGVERFDDASRYFKKMVDSGLKPNTNSYNKVIGGLVKAGRLDEAREFFDLMVEKEVKPNTASYEMLAKAFCEVERLDDCLRAVKGILMDESESVSLSEEMKELVETALRSKGREEDMGKLYEEVEREKAEAVARAEEEKARAEALEKEEEDRKKAEAAAKKEAADKATALTMDTILRRKENKEEAEEVSAEIATFDDGNAVGATAAETKEETGSQTGDVVGQVTAS